jgi:hypothetical protein
MTPKELEAIKRRCEAASRGAWAPDPHLVFRSAAADENAEKGYTIFGPIQIYDNYDRYYFNEADAEFISHSITDVPALVAEVERLRGLLRDVGNTLVETGIKPHSTFVKEIREATGDEW